MARPHEMRILSQPGRAAWPLRSLILMVLAMAAPADDWPAWRGASGSGICGETNLPVHWSDRENVRWRTSLPDRGNSTPIVWGDRVFVTQATGKTGRRAILCFNRHDGQLAWEAGTTWAEPESTHADNPPCSSSPVTDGRRVIAWFGSAGVHCYDPLGRELWRRDLGRQSHEWGYASSPALHGNLCFLNFGPGPRSFLVALDKRNGRTVWQCDVPRPAAASRWEDFGGQSAVGNSPGNPTVAEIAGSWATPLVVRSAHRSELIVGFALRCLAFVPGTGRVLWTCDGPNIGAYSSPFFGEGTVVLNGSGLRNTVLAVRPGGRGDVTATHRLWLQEAGFGKTCIGAGIIHEGHVYQVNMTGLAECRSLKTGAIVWEERLTGTGARQASWSAPILAGKRLYVPNRNADVFVLKASPKFECLATNSIGGEPMNASLAASNGDLLLRTDKHLWCIGAP